MTAAPDQDQLTASGSAYLFPDRFPAPQLLGTRVDPAYQAIRYQFREAIDDLRQQPSQPSDYQHPGLG